MRAKETKSTGLLVLLADASVDNESSLIDEVISTCCISAVGSLSAVSRWHHEHCRTRLHVLHDEHVLMERDLASRLGYFYHAVPEMLQLLGNVRALTVPDNLPCALRPMLGQWLREEGRLGKVSCVRCMSWIRTGEIVGWVELESVRAGEPERMMQQERLALDKLDTPDGLLKTVLQHAHRTLCKYDVYDLMDLHDDMDL